MKIRRATIKDIDEISRLFYEYGKYEHKLNKNVKVGSFAEIKKEGRVWFDLGTRYFLAEVDGKVVGSIAFNFGKIGKERIGVIHTIIVLEKFRGRGIGNEMVNKVINYFREKKCRRVKSFVHIGNKESYKFWKKQGFIAEEGYAINRMLK